MQLEINKKYNLEKWKIEKIEIEEEYESRIIIKNFIKRIQIMK